MGTQDLVVPVPVPVPSVNRLEIVGRILGVPVLSINQGTGMVGCNRYHNMFELVTGKLMT
jgi:hypothetical protein